jgi:beta-phosphoglucomutase
MSKQYLFAGVLFDLDGVVINTTELHYRVWNEFARSRNYSPTPAELLATNGKRADETIRAWLGADLTEQEVAALTSDREKYFNRLLATEPVSAVAGVESFIAELAAAKIPHAVATSAVPDNAELVLIRVGLRNSFDAVITAADVRRGKPDPEPYLKAAAAIGVPIAQCIVFEDSISGIRSARAAGARCAALTTTFPRDALAMEKPDWLIADFRDMPIELRP